MTDKYIILKNSEMTDLPNLGHDQEDPSCSGKLRSFLKLKCILNIRAFYTRKISRGLYKPRLTQDRELDRLYERGLYRTQSARINWFTAYSRLMPRFCVGCHSNREIA